MSRINRYIPEILQASAAVLTYLDNYCEAIRTDPSYYNVPYSHVSDFFITVTGSAIEMMGKYEKVMDYEAGSIRTECMLECVQRRLFE